MLISWMFYFMAIFYWICQFSSFSVPASFRPLALFLSRLFELDRSAFFDASVLERDTNDRLWFRCMGGVGFGFGVCGPWVACSINHYLVLCFFSPSISCWSYCADIRWVDDVRLQMSYYMWRLVLSETVIIILLSLRPSTFHPFKSNAYMPAY